MIRRLQLTNWRNYEDVSIDFAAGTTFVVASNGVGKTSLVEAARWALFGTPSSGSASPVRIGAEQGSATVELALPTGRILTVARSVSAREARQSALPAIDLDGEALDAEAFDAVLWDAYGTESGFLSRLTMPAASREHDTPAALGLEGHLGRYLGIDGLQQASEFLAGRLKSTEKQIRQIKLTNASSARQLAELEAAVTSAAVAVAEATRNHTAHQKAQEVLSRRQQALLARETWAARQDQWFAQTGNLLNEITREVGSRVDRASSEARMAEQIEALGLTIENVRIQIAVRESQAALIRSNEASLNGSHDACPVCRRPLDDATIAQAHESNEADLGVWETEIAALRSEEAAATTRRHQLQALVQRWRSVPDPGPEPELSTDPLPASTEMEVAASRGPEALDRLVEARSALMDTERRLREAREADDAMRRLTSLFRDEAKLRVTLATTRATLVQLLEQTVRPLASEIDQRWKALFPDRGEISTHADGSISRNVNGRALPYGAFSTGESMVTTIVLRLLVAQMATSADFCWFDEPLEHLDPDVRRQVANILARAPDGNGQLRQVVVTTYEEPLARHLAARQPEHVHLVDVRHAAAPGPNRRASRLPS